MLKPVIGITANRRLVPSADDLPWAYSPAGFVTAVEEAGGIPLLLPIVAPELAPTYMSLIDKLILIGGQNVDPSFYGQVNEAKNDDFLLERDHFEIALIKEAIKQNKPIFSVCRGTQLMNVVLGGTLNQAIENHWQDASSDYLSQDMVVKEGSALSDIYGFSSKINSFHHQSINNLAQELEVIASDPADGTIEAVQAKASSSLRYLGVQWHPELLRHARPEDQALFDYVVNRL